MTSLLGLAIPGAMVLGQPRQLQGIRSDSGRLSVGGPDIIWSTEPIPEIVNADELVPYVYDGEEMLPIIVDGEPLVPFVYAKDQLVPIIVRSDVI